MNSSLDINSMSSAELFAEFRRRLNTPASPLPDLPGLPETIAPSEQAAVMPTVATVTLPETVEAQQRHPDLARSMEQPHAALAPASKRSAHRVRALRAKRKAAGISRIEVPLDDQMLAALRIAASAYGCSLPAAIQVTLARAFLAR
jgi:hypothetical protein